MKNIETFKTICAFLFFVTQTGCIYESQTITGKVVDESGVEIRNVVVKACYSGWGWSSNGLVWDKDYCSEPAVTDNAGVYSINFNGPTFMRLMARKEGWIQRQDFNSSASRITLTRLETYLKREAAKRALSEQEFKKRQPGESSSEYYCRVILNRSGKVTLNYIDQKIMVFQDLLEFEGQPMALFALQGSYKAASSFANEAVLKINGREVGKKLSLQSDETSCQSDIYFIETYLPYSNDELNRRIAILVPGIKAMFDMSIWG